MVTFLGYFLLMLIASIAFPWIYAFAIMPLFVLVAAVGGDGQMSPSKLRRAATYSAMAAVMIATAYILCGWSAYVAFMTLKVTMRPSVNWDWIYFLTGFALCNGPLGYMAGKESPSGGVMGAGTCAHIAICMLAYVLFCIWPWLAGIPYGWFLRFLI